MKFFARILMRKYYRERNFQIILFHWSTTTFYDKHKFSVSWQYPRYIGILSLLKMSDVLGDRSLQPVSAFQVTMRAAE